MPNYRVIGRPFKGRAVGETIRLTHVEGRALVAMKRVAADDGHDTQAVPQEPSAPPTTTTPTTAKKATKRATKKPAKTEADKAAKKAAKKATKRTYRRRDMQAEG